MRRFCLLLLLLIVVTAGCQKRDLLTEDLLDSQMAAMKVDDLNRSLDFVFSDGRFNQEEFEDKLSLGLSRWSDEVVRSGDNGGNWKLDSGFQSVVDQYAELPQVQHLDDLSFLNSDGYYIQQAAWLKRIGDRVKSNEVAGMHELYRLLAEKAGADSGDFASYVAALNPGLSEEDSEQLAVVMQLFDWVSRNIQLLETVEVTDELREQTRLIREEGKPDPESGVAGLGYKRFPWQVLLFGRGDYVEKSKLFIALCEQMEFDAVMLAYTDENDQLVPWLPAVKIGDEFFLFDSVLGLPIPGKTTGSVATLSDVRADGKLLTDLDLSLEESTRDNTRYRVRPEQVKELTALIYASPQSISRRMKFLEDRLVGERRLILASEPEALRKAVEGIEGVEAQAWDVAFKTQQFRDVVNLSLDLARTDNRVKGKLDTWYTKEESYINDYVIYRTARNLYFIGKFESERNSRRANAVQRFSTIMFTDEQIENLAADRGLLYQLGILKAKGQDVNDFNRKLIGKQELMRMVRRDAGYFLAQSTFDNGNISTGANWLDRIEELGYSERWNTGIDYLKGRCYEARKEFDRAIELYSEGKYNQFHGNLLRARMLKEAIEK